MLASPPAVHLVPIALLLRTALLPLPARAGVRHFAPLRVPWPQDVNFEPTNRKHRWCDNVKDVWGSTMGSRQMFRHALSNHHLSIVFMHVDGGIQWIKYDPDKRRLLGGYFADIIEELSQRTGFHWHESFAVVGEPNSSAHETYDGWIEWAVSHYDLAVGEISITASRRGSGFRFAFPFMDTSPVLVSQVHKNHGSLMQVVFSWLRPFEIPLWIAIAASLFVTAFVYNKLEIGYHGGWNAFGQALYLAATSYTSQCNFVPTNRFNKVFTIWWTFAVMLIVSAYTANLASLLVVKETKSTEIKGIHDAIKKNVPICVYRGGAYDKFLRDRYPDLSIKYPKVWGYDNVRNGNCVAMVKDHFYWLIESGQKEHNGDCDLDTVGHSLLDVRGSFVSRGDSGVNCTDLVMDVISYTMQEMYNDGWFSEATEKFLATVHDHDCSQGADIGEKRKALGLEHMGGIFGLHIIVSFVCLLGSCLTSGCKVSDACRSGSSESDNDVARMDSEDYQDLHLDVGPRRKPFGPKPHT